MKWDNVIKNSLNRFDIWDLGTAPLSKHVWNNLSHKCHISTVITQRFAHFVTLALDHRHVECSCFVDKAREHTKFVGWKDSLARTTLDPVGNNPHLLKGGKGTTIRKAWSEPFLSLKQKIQMLEACDLSLETSSPCFRQDARPLMRQMKRLSWTFWEDWNPHCDPDAEDAPYHVRFARSWIVFYESASSGFEAWSWPWSWRLGEILMFSSTFPQKSKAAKGSTGELISPEQNADSPIHCHIIHKGWSSTSGRVCVGGGGGGGGGEVMLYFKHSCHSIKKNFYPPPPPIYIYLETCFHWIFKRVFKTKTTKTPDRHRR